MCESEWRGEVLGFGVQLGGLPVGGGQWGGGWLLGGGRIPFGVTCRPSPTLPRSPSRPPDRGPRQAAEARGAAGQLVAAGRQRAVLPAAADARRAGVLRARRALGAQRDLYGEGRGLREGGARRTGRGFGRWAGPMEAAYGRGGTLRKGRVRRRSRMEGRGFGERRGLWERRSFRKGADTRAGPDREWAWLWRGAGTMETAYGRGGALGKERG